METIRMRAELKPGGHMIADAQRRAGGVRWECLDCHAFHTSPTALLFVNEQKAAMAAKQKTGEKPGAKDSDKNPKGGKDAKASGAQ